MIPKAELHVHLEGTAPPDLIRRIAQRNGLPVLSLKQQHQPQVR